MVLDGLVVADTLLVLNVALLEVLDAGVLALLVATVLVLPLEAPLPVVVVDSPDPLPSAPEEDPVLPPHEPASIATTTNHAAHSFILRSFCASRPIGQVYLVGPARSRSAGLVHRESCSSAAAKRLESAGRCPVECPRFALGRSDSGPQERRSPSRDRSARMAGRSPARVDCSRSTARLRPCPLHGEQRLPVRRRRVRQADGLAGGGGARRPARSGLAARRRPRRDLRRPRRCDHARAEDAGVLRRQHRGDAPAGGGGGGGRCRALRLRELQRRGRQVRLEGPPADRGRPLAAAQPLWPEQVARGDRHVRPRLHHEPRRSATVHVLRTAGAAAPRGDLPTRPARVDAARRRRRLREERHARRPSGAERSPGARAPGGGRTHLLRRRQASLHDARGSRGHGPCAGRPPPLATPAWRVRIVGIRGRHPDLQARATTGQTMHLVGEANWHVGVSIERAQRELGYDPPYDIDQGMADAVAWCRSQGLLS